MFQLVHLYHGAINFVAQFIPFFLEFCAIFYNLIEILTKFSQGIDFEPSFLQGHQGVPMSEKSHAFYERKRVDEDIQRPGGRDFWIELSYGSCSSISWIGKYCLPIFLPLFVHIPKAFQRHVDLASNFYVCESLITCSQRNTTNGLKIEGNILTYPSVSSSGTSCKRSSFIN